MTTALKTFLLIVLAMAGGLFAISLLEEDWLSVLINLWTMTVCAVSYVKMKGDLV